MNTKPPLLCALAVLAIVGAALFGPNQAGATAAGQAQGAEGVPAHVHAATLYQRPMHPWIMSENPERRLHHRETAQAVVAVTTVLGTARWLSRAHQLRNHPAFSAVSAHKRWVSLRSTQPTEYVPSLSSVGTSGTPA